MAQKEEYEIKEICLGDLSIAMDIIAESNHPDKENINDSLQTIDEFCERWWET